jgi:hypothetical protein
MAMMNDYIEEEVVVRPIHGMQLSEGYIRKDEGKGYLGSLPGLMPSGGKTAEEVREKLEKMAKAYYGDDVVVEIAPRLVAG